MKRSVRRFAWLLAAAGAAVTACALLARFAPLIAVGLVLMGAGIWNLCRPSIGGLLVDGGALVLTGAFNCLAWLWLPDARTTALGKSVLAGVLQIVWGVRRLALYPEARSSMNDARAIARLETIVRGIAQRGAREDSGIVELRTGGLLKRRHRIGLFAEGAMALIDTAVRLEKRGDISIEASGTTWHGRTVKVRVQMSDFELTGEMTTGHLERFERWKHGAVQQRSIAA